MLALGGFVNSSVVVLWSITSLLGALLFVGRHQAIGWFLAYLALITISAVLEPFGNTTTNLTPAMRTIFFVMNIGCTSIVVFVLLQFFVRQKEATLQLLHAGYEKIAKKNQELIELHQRADRIFSALAEALPGTVLDEKYRLDEKIGSGGFGVVFRGTHLQMKRLIAVKIFKPMPGNDSAEGLQRFQLEAVSASRVNHPNAVVVLDSGVSAEGIAYLVMELLSGRSLKEELGEKGSLSLARTAAILIPVCDVISKAHAAGILHRDIKPDNIFLNETPEGEVVKVVDFGIAKLADNNLSLDIKKLTATGGIIGTPVYMAPERFDGNSYDGKSDVYSIGVLLYEMLAGRVPFLLGSAGTMGLIMQLVTTEPPPLRKFAANIPEKVEAIVMRAISKDPAKRPTARELAIEFANAININNGVLASIKSSLGS
jgi:serine/threonine protein kinase